MREIFSLVLGLLAAPLVSGVLFAAFSSVIDWHDIQTVGYVVSLFLIGLVFSAITTFFLALPIFIFLRRFGRVRWWSATAVGFVLGGLIGSGLSSPIFRQSPDAIWLATEMRNVIGIGSIGAIAGLTFWAIWVQGLKEPMTRH